MEKEIIVIADAASIFVNSMIDGIKQVGFECRLVTMFNISAETLMADNTLEILWLSDELAVNYETLLFIKNLYVKYNKKLFLYGYSNQIKLVKDYLPASVVADTFERPITPKEIASRLILGQNGSKQANSAAKKYHILVVDDSGAMLRAVKGWLEPKYKVSIVNSANNAMAFLTNNKPDLILLDYEMPVCSGPMFLEMLKKDDKTKDIPVIFLTAKGDRYSVETALALQPNGYILKSMKPSVIVQRIEDYIKEINKQRR